MNEKIKLLAEQSGFYFYDLHDIDGQDLGETIEADSWSCAEKFAELIIKECCNKLESTEIVSGYVAIFLANEIKEHFGLDYERKD